MIGFVDHTHVTGLNNFKGGMQKPVLAKIELGCWYPWAKFFIVILKLGWVTGSPAFNPDFCILPPE
jgi:hypothetical protein